MPNNTHLVGDLTSTWGTLPQRCNQSIIVGEPWQGQGLCPATIIDGIANALLQCFRLFIQQDGSAKDSLAISNFLGQALPWCWNMFVCNYNIIPLGRIHLICSNLDDLRCLSLLICLQHLFHQRESLPSRKRGWKRTTPVWISQTCCFTGFRVGFSLNITQLVNGKQVIVGFFFDYIKNVK